MPPIGNRDPVLRPARKADLPLLCRYIQAYCRREDIEFNLYRIERGLLPLLDSGDHGRVWMIEAGGNSMGYAVLCFCYSIQSGGREGRIDEFY
ncbi:MAG: hypothetical protein ACREUU_00300, partial [Gammaproteobacteria bacterium]